MQSFEIAIVGAGVMGAAAACELAGEGANVVLIDQSRLPNPQAASVDHSKVFRFAYPDPFYVSLAADSISRWRELESITCARLLTPTGALLIGRREPSFETDCYDAMRALGHDSERLDTRQVCERFPQFNHDAFAYGVYDPAGAILHAEEAVRALIGLARQRGVNIIEGARVIDMRRATGAKVAVVTDAGEFEARRALISSGPWAHKLLTFLQRLLTTTLQEVVYFEPAGQSHSSKLNFEPHHFPIFLDLDSGFYGFPIHHAGAMKIANHHKGVEVDPDSPRRQVDELFIESCRAFFREFIPGLGNARVTETRVCIYNNTPDDDFIVDWHPEIEGVLVATGFSGHGFKFGPTIGRIAADLLITGNAPFDIDRFSLTRFNRKHE